MHIPRHTILAIVAVVVLTSPCAGAVLTPYYHADGGLEGFSSILGLEVRHGPPDHQSELVDVTFAEGSFDDVFGADESTRHREPYLWHTWEDYEQGRVPYVAEEMHDQWRDAVLSGPYGDTDVARLGVAFDGHSYMSSVSILIPLLEVPQEHGGGILVGQIWVGWALGEGSRDHCWYFTQLYDPWPSQWGSPDGSAPPVWALFSRSDVAAPEPHSFILWLGLATIGFVGTALRRRRS